MSDDREIQEEEVLALQAIYDHDFHIDSNTRSTYHFTLRLDDDDDADARSPRLIVIEFHVPEQYPSASMPIYEITSVYCGTRKIEPHVRKEIDDQLQAMFVPGEVVLFEWINWLKDYLEATYTKEDEDVHSQVDEPVAANDVNEDTADSPEDEYAMDDVDCPDIQSSDALVDRKSVFVAHVATVTSVDQVQAVRRRLLQNKKIAKATHNILAYRIQHDTGVIAQDNDDDGETAAGGRLLHLLQILDVTNVVVIVSRWYGGIQLHADRFKDINNCARQALETFGYLDDSKKNKKKK